MATINANEENLREAVEAGKTVIVDFWAEWCGPCKAFGPIFEEVSEEFPDVVFAKVDTEAQQALAAGFQITAIPTLMIFREGVLLFRESGALPKEAFKELIGEVLKLDMKEIHEKIAADEAEKG